MVTGPITAYDHPGKQTIGWPLGHFFVFVLRDLCKLQVTVCANFMNVDMDLNVKNQWIPLEQNQ